jgi:hypothetical protein
LGYVLPIAATQTTVGGSPYTTLYATTDFSGAVTFATGATLTSAGGSDIVVMKLDGVETLPPQASITISNVSQPEGNSGTTSFNFTVSRGGQLSGTTTVNWNTADGTATAASGDYVAASGQVTFGPGEATMTITVLVNGDTMYEPDETLSVNLSGPSGGTISGGTGTGTIVNDDPAVTKFYVVNDASPDRDYEYGATGTAVTNYTIASSNTAPRGVASTAAGNKVWVVDSNKNVYVFDTNGGLLGSWAAGSLPAKTDLQGISVNGTDVWIVDAKGDKVYRYANAAGLLSGTATAASSFSLNSSNANPTDLVTDGTSIWVVNDSTADSVFKYTVSGTLLGSWTISGAGSSPTGITIDPTNVSDIWIVDSATDKVYVFSAAASRTSSSQSPSSSFALAAGNTSPQGIADPPPATDLRAMAGSSGGAISSADDATDSPYDFALLAVVSELDGLLGTTGNKKRG